MWTLDLEHGECGLVWLKLFYFISCGWLVVSASFMWGKDDARMHSREAPPHSFQYSWMLMSCVGHQRTPTEVLYLPISHNPLSFSYHHWKSITWARTLAVACLWTLLRCTSSFLIHYSYYSEYLHTEQAEGPMQVHTSLFIMHFITSESGFARCGSTWTLLWMCNWLLYNNRQQSALHFPHWLW